MDEGLIEREIMQLIHAAVKCPSSGNEKRVKIVVVYKSGLFS